MIPAAKPDGSMRLENTGVRANRSTLAARCTYAAARELRRAPIWCAGDVGRGDTNLGLRPDGAAGLFEYEAAQKEGPALAG